MFYNDLECGQNEDNSEYKIIKSISYWLFDGLKIPRKKFKKNKIYYLWFIKKSVKLATENEWGILKKNGCCY